MVKEEVTREYSARKVEFSERLHKLLAENKNVLIIAADNVGSQSMHIVRAELRKPNAPKATILMGKNTMIKHVIRKFATETENPNFNKLADLCKLNVGLVFTNDDMKDIRDILERNKVVAAAKAGALAPKDVKIPAGPTGLEPTQTNFFQALGIATKIVKGTIEMITEVQLCTAGEKVGNSQAVLLTKLGVKPFEYGLKVIKVFSEGSVIDPAVLNIATSDVITLFQQSVARVTSVSLAIGYPAASAVPHMILNSYKNILAVAVSTDISFKQADKMKDMIANPGKYASSAPVAATAAAAPAAAKAAAPAAKAPEPEEEEDTTFSLFD